MDKAQGPRPKAQGVGSRPHSGDSGRRRRVSAWALGLGPWADGRFFLSDARNPLRNDDREHGAAAPQHARRAAARARARRREHRLGRPDDRLPAHRHREDLRTEEVAAGHPARRADGLPRRAVEQPRVLPVGREAARHRGGDSGARHLDPGAHRRVAAAVEPSRLARDARHGSRRHHGHALLLPRARAAAQHQRDDRGLPDVPELPPDRRSAGGSAARVPRRRHRVPRQVSGEARRVREAPHEEPGLAQAHQRRRLSVPRRHDGDGTRRTDGARGRHPVPTSGRRFPTSSTRRSISRSRRRPKATSSRGTR